uniref:Beta-1,4-glucuronyltransferase 1 n=1 Tax=Musca domestica TaxID=7370 RepID=A0A1I8MFG4_MUSDO
MMHKKYFSIKVTSIILLFCNVIWTIRLCFVSQHLSNLQTLTNRNATLLNGNRRMTLNAAAAGVNSPYGDSKQTLAAAQHLTSSQLLAEQVKSLNSLESFSLAFQNLSLNLGRWDNQRLYKLFDFALVGDNYEESSADSLICLATQTSVERLHSLAEVAKQFQGPISIAVFVAGNDEFTILQYYVTYLRLCFDFIRSNVTFHLAYPRERRPQHETADAYKLLQMFDCRYPLKTFLKISQLRTSETKRWRLRNLYPQNHLRNFARKGCQTKYVFLTDVDIIPSANIVPLLNEFLATASARCSSGLCAYVIPTLEIDERVRFPSHKSELLRLIKRGLARPFHEKVFIYNQFATNFSSWLANTQTDDRISISHQVTNYEFFYEPFYVALDNAPPHDERFVGYGFTRNSQVYEMYIAGYSFHVLTPVFTCHWGLQKKNNARPSWREQQNTINSKRFEIFKKEIFARYKHPPIKQLFKTRT